MRLLRVARRTYFVAGSAIFAAIYSILGLFPVSAYVGVPSFLTFREILSPLAGMIFGPLMGGTTMVLGNFIDFALHKPVVFDFLDFVPDMVTAVVAGLVFTGRNKLALAIPIVLLVWYSLDPLSAVIIIVLGIPIPFYWMHLLSVATLLVALSLEKRGVIHKISPIYVAATVFASTMAGHIAGSILYENILVRVNQTLTASAITGQWYSIFFLYPPERILFTILGTLVSVPVLRSLTRTGRTRSRVS